jgi:hypothetical protein
MEKMTKINKYSSSTCSYVVRARQHVFLGTNILFVCVCVCVFIHMLLLFYSRHFTQRDI